MLLLSLISMSATACFIIVHGFACPCCAGGNSLYAAFISALTLTLTSSLYRTSTFILRLLGAWPACTWPSTASLGCA